MLHLAMFLFFAAAAAATLALLVLMISENALAIGRALRMQPLHGHVPPTSVAPRLRVPVRLRPVAQPRPLRAAA